MSNADPKGARTTTGLPPMNCEGCGKRTTEYCGGVMCRKCHVSLTFEECVDGSWANRQRAAAGLPPVKP